MHVNRNILASLVIVLILSGCATISYLPSDSSATFPRTDSIKVFFGKPEVPYTEIGLIVAESGDYTEEVLFGLLKKKAMSIGAQGIIMRNLSQETGTIGIPSSLGGTMMVPVTSHRLEAIAIRFGESPGH